MSAAAEALSIAVPERRVVRQVVTTVTLPGEGALSVAVEVRWPDPQTYPPPALALVCLPGGGMSRHFYDLVAADGGDEFSFAAQMTARGCIVILVDHLGVGDSSRPQDVFALTPEVVVRANTQAVDDTLAALRAGSLTAELPALPRLKSIGVGHSMGALLTVMQQAEARTHAAIAVLGFGTAGLPQYLSPPARELAATDLMQARTQVVTFALAMFGAKPSTSRRESMQTGDLYAGAKADPRGVLAIKQALSTLLPVPAMLAMLPGNIGVECAAIDVPVFIGVGELDMTGPAHAIPAAFSGSLDVTLHVLPQAGHSHFLFPARVGLFERLAAWAKAVAHSTY